MSDGKDNRIRLAGNQEVVSLVAIPGGECYGKMNIVYGLTCSQECVGEIPRLCVKATLRYWKHKSEVSGNHEEGTVY